MDNPPTYFWRIFMNSELREASDELEDMYTELKEAADNNEVGWQDFSQKVQRFTRSLFRYKRMRDQAEQETGSVSR